MPKRPAETMSPKPSEAPTLQFLDEKKRYNYRAEKRPRLREISNRLQRTLFSQPSNSQPSNSQPSNSVGNHDKKRKDQREKNKERARQYRQGLQHSGNETARQALFIHRINSA